MAMRPTMIHLPDELISRLDRRAAEHKVSRAQVIREAVSAYLDAAEPDAIGAAYANGYGRIPFGTPDEWGDVGAWHEELARGRQGAGESWR